MSGFSYGLVNLDTEEDDAVYIVNLGRNYRSQRAIVDAALQAIAPSSLAPGRHLEAMAAASPELVVIHEAASEKAEATSGAAGREASAALADWRFSLPPDLESSVLA